MSIESLRNLALIGPSGSGKTLLAERLLVASQGHGDLGKGSAAAEQHPLEKLHGHSIFPKLLSLQHAGRTIRLFDTPGHPDLRGEGMSVLEAVETAVLVIDAKTGLPPLAASLFTAAGKRGLDRVIVVNKIDRDVAELPRLLTDLQRLLGAACLPVNLPDASGARVIDCYFEPRNQATAFSSVAAAHRALVERVVEVDDELLARYLETNRDIRPEELHAPLEKALREGALVPVAFASALTGAGADELLQLITELMPCPLESTPPQFLMGKERRPVTVRQRRDAHVLAHVFRVSADPFAGRIALMRVHQGVMQKGAQLYAGSASKPLRLARLAEVHGKELRDLPEAGPGDIVATTRAEGIRFDDVLHDHHEEDDIHLAPIEFPRPTYGLALAPRKHGDDQKLSDALRALTDEDRCLEVEHVGATGELVLRGLGDLHLRIVLEELRERFHVDVDTRPPKIAYRETIGREAAGHHRHKKQTGGAGQFGEVSLRVEPLPRGAGFEFVDAVKGGAIPGQFIPAVEKGVRQVLAQGCVAGFPMQDVRCTVTDGKHHPVDSKEVAFVAAGRQAFIDAVKKASPLILEPVGNLTVLARAEHMGGITGELASRRGQITGSESRGDGAIAVFARAPLAELRDLEPRLRSLSGGQASHLLELSHYDPAPPQVQQELMRQFRPPSEE